jgi:hypothetical protein
MAVIIDEIEQLPPGGDAPRTSARGTAGDASRPDAQSAPQPAQVMAVIRREASRAARLWAD